MYCFFGVRPGKGGGGGGLGKGKREGRGNGREVGGGVYGFWVFLFVFSSHDPSSASETKEGGEWEVLLVYFLCSSILSLRLFNISQL